MHSRGPGQKRNENGEFRILEKQSLSGPDMSERPIPATRFPREVKFVVELLVLERLTGWLAGLSIADNNRLSHGEMAFLHNHTKH
jgi:hypothetical protein